MTAERPADVAALTDLLAEHGLAVEGDYYSCACGEQFANDYRFVRQHAEHTAAILAARVAVAEQRGRDEYAAARAEGYEAGRAELAAAVEALVHEDWCCARGCAGYGFCEGCDGTEADCRCMKSTFRAALAAAPTLADTSRPIGVGSIEGEKDDHTTTVPLDRPGAVEDRPDGERVHGRSDVPDRAGPDPQGGLGDSAGDLTDARQRGGGAAAPTLAAFRPCYILDGVTVHRGGCGECPDPLATRPASARAVEALLDTLAAVEAVRDHYARVVGIPVHAADVADRLDAALGGGGS